MTVPAIAEVPDEGATRPGLARRLALRFGYGTTYSLTVYVATRLAVAIGVGVAYLVHRKLSWHQVLTVEDAWWYQHIAAHGYGTHLHLHLAADPHHNHYSPWAFYPGYPLLIRAVHDVTQLSYPLASFLIALITGALAVRAVYAVGDAYGGMAVARAGAALFAGWPGSAAMFLPYSEGLFIASAAGALAMLMRRRWLLAGLLGAVASGTRAVGAAVVVAALVVAVRELVRRHDPRPLVAPLLAVCGAGGFYLYGWQRTGDPLIWQHAEQLWHQKLDFGQFTVFVLTHELSKRGGGATETLLLIPGIAMVLLMLVALIALRRRLDLVLATYFAVAAFMVLADGHVGPRPRMILALIPGFIWIARWFPSRLVDIVTVSFASMLALVAFLYVGTATP